MCHQIVLHAEEVGAVLHYAVLLLGVYNCYQQFMVGLPYHTYHQVFL